MVRGAGRGAVALLLAFGRRGLLGAERVAGPGGGPRPARRPRPCPGGRQPQAPPRGGGHPGCRLGSEARQGSDVWVSVKATDVRLYSALRGAVTPFRAS